MNIAKFGPNIVVATAQMYCGCHSYMSTCTGMRDIQIEKGSDDSILKWTLKEM